MLIPLILHHEQALQNARPVVNPISTVAQLICPVVTAAMLMEPSTSVGVILVPIMSVGEIIETAAVAVSHILPLSVTVERKGI